MCFNEQILSSDLRCIHWTRCLTCHVCVTLPACRVQDSECPGAGVAASESHVPQAVRGHVDIRCARALQRVNRQDRVSAGA